MVQSIYPELMGRSHVLEFCPDLEHAVKWNLTIFRCQLVVYVQYSDDSCPIIFSTSLNPRGLAPMD